MILLRGAPCNTCHDFCRDQLPIYEPNMVHAGNIYVKIKSLWIPRDHCRPSPALLQEIHVDVNYTYTSTFFDI